MNKISVLIKFAAEALLSEHIEYERLLRIKKRQNYYKNNTERCRKACRKWRENNREAYLNSQRKHNLKRRAKQV